MIGEKHPSTPFILLSTSAIDKSMWLPATLPETNSEFSELRSDPPEL